MFFPGGKKFILSKDSQTSGACPYERIMKMEMICNNGEVIPPGGKIKVSGENPTQFHVVQLTFHANCLGTEFRSVT
jgi:hypothetical protein